MQRNEQRCQQILECKRQIEFWRSKLDVLEKEQTMQIKLARLRLDASSTWRSLSPRDRMDKRLILAAMESDKLPTSLDDFPNCNLPPSIRSDKDILLARVARNDFQEKYDDERFFVPPNLRGDKKVMMAIIPKAPTVIECMSNNLRNDDEIFEILLSSTSTIPNHVLQHFSDRIRSNKKMILQLCSHRNGISSFSFASPNLRNDKAFMIEAIEASYPNSTMNKNCSSSSGRVPTLSERKDGSNNSSYQILRYASQRLQDDHDVVHAAVRKNGLNLKYASYHLRRDFDIVTAAIEENGEAFRYCLPGEVKDHLLSDRNLVLNRIIKNAWNDSTFKTCLDRFQTDQEMILEALASSNIDWSLIPQNLRESREFVKNAVKRNPQSYLNISESFRQEFTIASAVIKCEAVDNNVLVEATEQCPRLLSDRESMLTITKCWWTDVLHEMLQFTPIEIRGDKTIMLNAIKNNPSTYELCSEELSMDRDIILETIKSRPSYLYQIPEALQFEDPEIVICAIKSCKRSDAWSLYEDICEEMWSNRDVAISWLSKFGDWLHDDFPEEFEEDEEICLTLIERNWPDFENVSVALRSNKQFMLKALAVDARVIRAVEELRYDDDLTLLAFSKDKRAIQSYSGGDDFEYMVSLTKRLRKRIFDYDTFDRIFCTNVLCPAEKNPECSLSLLNQGPDAMKYHSQLIASYLGLPDKDELHMLYAASNNLRHWGF